MNERTTGERLTQWAVMRSFPPPTSRSLPYRSSSHISGMPLASNAMLNDTRWPSRSVSASTPSQSNSIASSRGDGAARRGSDGGAAVDLVGLGNRREDAAAPGLVAAPTTNDGRSGGAGTGGPGANAAPGAATATSVQ